MFIEHEIEDGAAQQQQGTKGRILDPYYLPDAPTLPATTTPPMRAELTVRKES